MWCQVRLTLAQGDVCLHGVLVEKPWDTTGECMGGWVAPAANQKPHHTVHEPCPAEQSQARTIRT